MTAASELTIAADEDASFAIDETFLESVDRAVLVDKQEDPLRLARIHRALEEEIHLASAIGVVYLDRQPTGALL